MAPMRRKGNYMRNKSWLRFVALLSVLALVLAACGDGDEATDDTEADTTTTEAMEETTTTEAMEETTTTDAMDETTTTESMGEEGAFGLPLIDPLDVPAGDVLIAGSSTVFPFATAVAERFGNTTDFKTPVIESTGSGGVRTISVPYGDSVTFRSADTVPSYTTCRPNSRSSRSTRTRTVSSPGSRPESPTRYRRTWSSTAGMA